MRKSIKITLLISILSANVVSGFGQSSPDQIIFLTDFYTTFINKVEANRNNADSIYTEDIQNSICNTHFKKSEYAFIVKDFFAWPMKNTAALKQSIDKIVTNQQTIRTKILGALKKSRQYLENDSLTIYIIPVNPVNRKTIEGMTGIMGLTAGSKQIILTIEPDIMGWENMLEYAVAHEFNHASWTNLNFGKSAKWTLLDYLVFEGRGDYFANLLYPGVMTPWTKALTENQKSDLWNKIKPGLQSEDISYQMEIMFGSKNYPVWGGYSIGYDMVQKALTNNKSLKAANWTNLGADQILELSQYK